MGNHELAPGDRTLHLTAVTAQEHASSRTFLVLQKSAAVLRVLRRKHLLRGSTVLSYCVLPPVHIGQDLVYSGITSYEPFTKC